MAINDPDGSAAQLMAAFNDMNQNIGNLNNNIKNLMSIMNQTKQKTATSQTEIRQQALQIKQESAYFSDVIEQNKILNATTRNLGANVINNLRNITKNDKGQLNYLEKARQREDIRDIQNKTKTRKDGVFTRFLSTTLTEIDRNIGEIKDKIIRGLDERTRQKMDLSAQGYSAAVQEEIRGMFRPFFDSLSQEEKSKLNIPNALNELTKTFIEANINKNDITKEVIETVSKMYASGMNPSREVAKQLITLSNMGVNLSHLIDTTNASLIKAGYFGDKNSIYSGLSAENISKRSQLWGLSSQQAAERELEFQRVKYMVSTASDERVGEFIGNILNASLGEYSAFGSESNYMQQMALLGLDYKQMQGMLSKEGGAQILSKLLIDKIKSIDVNRDPRAAAELAKALNIPLEEFYKIRSNDKLGKLEERFSDFNKKMAEGYDYRTVLQERIVSPEEKFFNEFNNSKLIERIGRVLSDHGILIDGSFIQSGLRIIGAVIGTKISAALIGKAMGLGGEGLLGKLIGVLSGGKETILKSLKISIGGLAKAIPVVYKGFQAVGDFLNGDLIGMLSKFGSMALYFSPVGPVIAGFDAAIAVLNQFGLEAADSSDILIMFGLALKKTMSEFVKLIDDIGDWFRDKGFNIPKIGSIKADESFADFMGVGSEYRSYKLNKNKKRTIGEANKIQVFQGKTDADNIPGLDIGLKNVPYNEFPAYLHKGEMVLTKEEAEAYRSFMDRIKSFEKGVSPDGNFRKGSREESENILFLDELVEDFNKQSKVYTEIKRSDIDKLSRQFETGDLLKPYIYYNKIDSYTNEGTTLGSSFLSYPSVRNNNELDTFFWFINILNNKTQGLLTVKGRSKRIMDCLEDYRYKIIDRMLNERGYMNLRTDYIDYLYNSANSDFIEWFNFEKNYNKTGPQTIFDINKATGYSGKKNIDINKATGYSGKKNRRINKSRKPKTKQEEQQLLFEMMVEDGTGGAHYNTSDLDAFTDSVRGGWKLSISEYAAILNNYYKKMQENQAASKTIRKIDGPGVGLITQTSQYLNRQKYALAPFDNMIDKLKGSNELINKLKEDKLGIVLISSFRNSDEQKKYYEAGLGSKKSLHQAGLAFDYNLIEGDNNTVSVGNKQGLSSEIKNKYNEYSTLIEKINSSYESGKAYRSWDGNHIQLKRAVLEANRSKYVDEILKKQRELNNQATKSEEEVKILKEQLECLQNIYINNKEESDRNKPKPVIAKPGPRAVLNHNNRTR